MTEEERVAALIQTGLNSTIELALDCAKRTDEINKRLIIAIVVLTVVFGATTCVSKYIDYKSTYSPALEQIIQMAQWSKQTNKERDKMPVRKPRMPRKPRKPRKPSK